MSAQTQISNKVLNLVQLQDRMEELVFNHIDTSQKWDKAYSGLTELLNQSVSYFNQSVENNKGELPKANTFWALFMDIESKLIYFNTLSYLRLKENQLDSIKGNILRLLVQAANCIPEVQKETNTEFLDEICNCYEEIENYNGKKGELKRIILAQNNRLDACLSSFKEFSETYK